MPDLLGASEEGRLGPGHAVTAEAARALALAAGVPARRCSRAGPGEAVRRQPLARVDPRRRFWSRFCKRRLGSSTCRIEKAEAVKKQNRSKP